jgi:para-nitrobenzyl esterase
LLEELKSDFPSFIVSLVGPQAPADDKAARAAFVAFESDMRFGWNMWAWARLHAAKDQRKTYYYRFSHKPPGEEGASHGAEMPYVFDHLDLRPQAWTETDRLLAKMLGSYWTNFAKTGNPNGEGLPDWPEFTPARESALLIGDPIRAGAVPNDADLAAIDRLYRVVRVLLKYGYLIAGLIGLAVLALLWRLVAYLRPQPQANMR